MVFGSLGLGAMLAGFLINPHPVKSQAEFMKLGEKFNEDLRRRLGLARLASSNGAVAEFVRNMRLSAGGGAQGGSLQLRGSF